MSDIENDPEFIAFAERALAELLPKLRDSHVVISLVPKTAADVKLAIETGFAVFLDKPIIAVVPPGAVISSKLAKIADRIIELDWQGEEGVKLLGARIGEAADEIFGPDGND